MAPVPSWGKQPNCTCSQRAWGRTQRAGSGQAGHRQWVKNCWGSETCAKKGRTRNKCVYSMSACVKNSKLTKSLYILLSFDALHLQGPEFNSALNLLSVLRWTVLSLLFHCPYGFLQSSICTPLLRDLNVEFYACLLCTKTLIHILKI